MTTTPLNTVFDLKMQEWALEASRKEYFKPRYLYELNNIRNSSRYADWEAADIAKLREKYKKKTGYDYK